MATVIFDPIEHKYWNALTGEEYTSVTKYIEEGKVFEKDKAIEMTTANPRSRYFGWNKEDVEREWDKIRDNGTELHKEIERWIKKEPLESIVAAHRQAVYHFSKGTFKGHLYSEMLVYSHKLKVAGTCDIVSESWGEALGHRVMRLYDIKSCTSIDSWKLEKYSKQLYMYAALLKETIEEGNEVNLSLFNEARVDVVELPTEYRVGGIIHYEDYLYKPKQAPKFLKCIDMSSWIKQQYSKTEQQRSTT